MRTRSIRSRERGRCQRVGLVFPARGPGDVVTGPQQLNLEVVGGSQWCLQLCAQLGIRGLKADGVGLSQGPFDGRERGVRLPNQPKCSRLLEVRFELFSDTAKPVQSRSSDREIRQG